MKSSLKDKTNQQKWYAPKQRFSIRKYHFGAASVLLGISLAVTGGEVAEATEVNATTESSVIVDLSESSSTDTSTEATAATEAETTETVASLTTDTSAETTERTVSIAYIIQYVLEDGTTHSATVETATVTTTDAVAKTTITQAAVLPDGYELAKDQEATVTMEVTEGSPNLIVFKLAKKTSPVSVAKPATEKTATAPEKSATGTSVATPASSNERAVAEQPASETDEETEAAASATKDADLAAAKVVLEQKLSEATVLATEADRTVATASSDTAALKAAAAATRLVVSEATAVLNNSAATLDQINTRIDAVRTNVEALALELRKFSKDGEIQVRLALANLAVPTKTVVQNVQNLTESEVRGIQQAVRNANPSLTESDTIVVTDKVSAGYAGGVTVYFNGNAEANEGSASLEPLDVIIGSTGNKNKDQLKEAINWFDFTTATIIYPDGTTVGAITGYSSTGIPIREVTYTDNSKGLTTDAKFQNLGVATYVPHIYYNGGLANNGKLYEVLQEGMTFVVPTSVEGYILKATVNNLGSKDVAQDPNQLADGTSTNAMFNYGNWTADDAKAFRESSDPTNHNYRMIKVVTTTNRNGTTTTVASQMSEDDQKSGSYVGSSRSGNTTTTYKKVLRGSHEAYIKTINKYGTPKAEVILMDLDSQWAYMKAAGLVETNFTGLIGFGASVDTSNVGVTFDLSATYNGQPTAVNVIATDAETAGTSEFVQFESNGTPWEDFMTLAATEGIAVPKSITQSNLSGERSLKGAGYDPKQFTDVTSSSEDIYGKQTFGPVTSGGTHGLAVGLTENVSKLTINIASAGTQQAAIGFVVYDAGDAPQEYGNARHIIGDFGSIVSENGVNKQITHTQPYLGDTKGDPDFQNTTVDKAYWTLDDVVYTQKYTEETLTSGMKVTNSDGKEGTFAIVNNNAVLRFSDGSTKALAQGEIIKIIKNDKDLVGIYNSTTKSIGIGSLPDEGESQLLDEKVATKYNIRRASDTSFILEGVEAHLGENNNTAYLRGWVDFDGNGKFDAYEASELITLTQDGTYNIEWHNVPQLSDTSQDWAGVRLRIGLTETEILSPTGTASSGEVEDFQAFVTHLPRGRRAETADYQDKVQTYTTPLNAYFTANGKMEPEFRYWAQIDANITPQFVLTEASVASSTATGTGRVNVTDTDGNTAYVGDEVRVFDANNKELGTAIKVVNELNGTTEYYLTAYTEYDTAGNKVGTYNLSTQEDDNGMTFLSIVFDPEPGFVGTAKGAVIRAWDDNNNSTGWRATAETIASSAKSATLAEKDKIYENVNDGFINNRRSMDSTYVPTVIDVRPVGEDEVSEDVQGATQTGRPVIPTFGTVETGTGADASEIYVNNKLVILDDKVPETFGNIPVTTPGKVYEEDTKVTEEITIVQPGGKSVTYAPQPKFAAGSSSVGMRGTVVTGTGFTLDNVRYAAGATVPAGVKTTTAIRTNSQVTYTDATGQTHTAQVGDTIPIGVTINGSFVAAQATRYDNVVFNTGDTVTYSTLYDESRFAADTELTQIVAGEGSRLLLNNEVYTVTNDTIPKGTKIPGKLTYVDYATQTLPNATHLDPVTGAISSVPRTVTKFTDTEIVIEGEGTYTLDQQTGVITFVPEPHFVGKGTGVYVQQPDIDYNDVVTGDPVTSAYGKDYGSAKYTPTVNPATTATITRTIHYVYDNDKNPDNNSTTDLANFDTPIVTIDNEAITKTQTLTYTRTFSFDEAGNLTVSEWQPVNDANKSFSSVISPTVPGYTAVVLPETHRDPNQHDAGVFTPAPNTIMADDSDNIDVYVVYSPDKQYAAIKYWDVYTGTPVELKTETVADDATLQGHAGEAIAYSTAADIADYIKKGYQLVYDAFTLPDGRPFDTEKDVDSNNPSQVYNVYLTHKQTISRTPQEETVVRTIKYVDDKGNPVIGADGQPIPDKVETLTFTREQVTDDVTKDVTYGEWVTTSDSNKFANVNSPEVPNYTTLNTVVEGTEAINPLADDQEIVVVYKPMVEVVVPPGTEPTDEVPGTNGKTYGELGLIEEVTFTVKHVYADGTPVTKDGQAVVKTQTVTFTRTVKLDGNTGEVISATYGAWTPATQDFAEVLALTKDDVAALENHTPSIEKATRTGVVATDKDTEVTIYYRTNVTVIDPKDPDNNPDTPTPETPITPETPVPNDPKGRTYGDLGLVEEVTLTVHHVYADGKPVMKDGKAVISEETLTFTRTVQIDAVTGDIIAGTYTDWAPASQNFATVNALTKDDVAALENFLPSVDDVTKENIVATANDIVETIIYRTNVKVVDPKDPDNNPDTPTPDTPITPDTPVPNDPKGRTYGDLGVVEAVTFKVHHVYADGTPVMKDGKPVVSEETLIFTRTVQVDAETGDIIAGTYTDWTPETQDFKEVSALTLENYKPSVASVAKQGVVATDKDAEATIIYNPIKIDVPPTVVTPPTDGNVDPNTPAPTDPKGRTYGELGLVEQVTRTVQHLYYDGTPVVDADGTPIVTTETVTFTRSVTIDSVTGDIIANTYTAWTPATKTFAEVPALTKDDVAKLVNYKANVDKVEAETVSATDADKFATIVYNAVGKVVDPKDPDNNPDTPTPETPITPETPVPNDPKGRTYGDLGLVEEVTLTVHHVYADGTPVMKDGKPVVSEETLTFTRTVQVDAETGDIIAGTYTAWTPATQDFADVLALTKDEVPALENYVSSVEKVEKTGVTATDKDAEATIIYTPKQTTVTPPTDGNVDPNTPVPTDPKGRTYEELGLIEQVTRTVQHLYYDGTPVVDADGTPIVTTETVTFTRSVDIDSVTG
ncbi:TPA: YSIRK-type signal peptide-containing protein, partial [Streptococcus suis]|nr:YSIRK-type signal peptide-containing protein [Streptococcus suis]